MSLRNRRKSTDEIMDTEKQAQDIVVQIAKNFKDSDISLSRLKELVKTICARFELWEATISIAIVDDAQICKLNGRFLGRDSTTDCLSFDLSDDKDRAKSFELIVNAEMAAKEAGRRGHCSEAELALYITHGLLHNLGFDDSTPGQARKMHETEDEILRQFGYGFIYNS